MADNSVKDAEIYCGLRDTGNRTRTWNRDNANNNVNLDLFSNDNGFGVDCCLFRCDTKTR